MNQNQLLSPKFSTLSKLKVKCVFISLIHVVHFLQPNAISVSFPFFPTHLDSRSRMYQRSQSPFQYFKTCGQKNYENALICPEGLHFPRDLSSLLPTLTYAKEREAVLQGFLGPGLQNGSDFRCLVVSTLRVFYCVARQARLQSVQEKRSCCRNSFSNLSGKMSHKVEETKLVKVMKVYVLNNMNLNQMLICGEAEGEVGNQRNYVGSGKIL